jgi:simple sugar transport system ATP-binding protein
VYGDFTKADIPLEQLVQMMAGGADLEALSHELEAASQEGEAGEGLAEAAELFRAEVDEG